MLLPNYTASIEAARFAERLRKSELYSKYRRRRGLQRGSEKVFLRFFRSYLKAECHLLGLETPSILDVGSLCGLLVLSIHLDVG